MRFIKQFVAALAAVLLLLPSCSFCEEAADGNLLKNPDYMHIGNDGLPAEWFTDAYISQQGYTVFGLAEGDPDHPVALSIRNIGENDARFAQTVKVEPDSLYCLSGYIRAEDVQGGHGANLSVEGIYAFSDKCFDTEGEWEYIEYYGETGPGQEYITVFARLGGYSGMSTGTACFAGLSLKKVQSVPGDGIADLWYRADSYDDEDYDEDDEDTGDEASEDFRMQLMLIGSLYTAVALVVLFLEHKKKYLQKNSGPVSPVIVPAVLLLSLLLRLVISWFVRGYMVDVNCFLSWGNTMVSAGPAGFYEATSFCDYPPLYTYILALNSWLSRQLGAGEALTRIIFRLVPNLCDLAGSWMLYRLLLRQKDMHQRASFLFLALAVFNPAAILNSAAWGQMDSVLCLMLVCVAMGAVNGKWKLALPLYVAAVLVKPQALMLGPLGLAYIVIAWIRKPASRRQILIGTGFSLLTLAAGVIPFSLRQDWDWLISLYGRTLASYPYATVNTANFYYILGGNWAGVNGKAHIAAPVILSVLSSGYGIWWYLRAKEQRYRLAETAVSFIFAAIFIIFACTGMPWTWNGGLAMAYAFVTVLSAAVRSRDIRMLPWLGGLLFILLYVFGVKMHERYLFPALMLLASAWILQKDRRILYILILYTFTVFMNEGIVLDNSIRLGSENGHLLKDTVWIADVISLLNILGAVYAAWLSPELFLTDGKPHFPAPEKKRSPLDWKSDRKLHWNARDTVLLSLITVIYGAVTLLTLGSTKAPQTCWTSSSAAEQIVFDLGEYRENVEILYFAQVSRSDFAVSASTDGENWQEETWAQMDQGQCWKWKYVTQSYENGDGTRTYYNSDEGNIIRFSGRYIRLTAKQFGLTLNEILFRYEDGEVIPVRICRRLNEETESELFSDPEALIDEQDTIENLPVFPSDAVEAEGKIQPSWWNSTYFDEIYHARTGFEFLKSYTPYETSHPPLGKILISAGIAIFGMTPFGWRFAGALAGIIMLPGMYLLLKQLTKKTWIASAACLLMALDCMHLTQTQIATIDSFPVLFIIFAYFFMLRFIQTDYIREKLYSSVVPLAMNGFFMGLSIASKWIGIYAGAGLAVLFFWHCFRVVRLQREAERTNSDQTMAEADSDRLKGWISANGAPDALKRTAVICIWCILFFVIIPVILYLLSYIPYLAYNFKRIRSVGDYISQVWQAQVSMLNYHSTPGLGMDHPFYSPWWEWPVIGKPMYYASKQYLPADSSVSYSIFAIGNPVIWFGGLAALLICICRALLPRRYRVPDSDYLWHMSPATYEPRYMFLLVAILAQYLPWVPVPRGTYIYHYFASLPFLMTAICLCFDMKNRKAERISGSVAAVFILTAFIFFVLLFPYASGLNMPVGWLDIGKKILRVWY